MLSEAASSILSLSSLAAAAPAGGAESTQVAIATAGGALASTVLLALAMGHRSGRIQILARMAASAERVSGLPGWAALPTAIAAVALNVALLGMYWDISLHIDNGRDPGPLANPAHYLILAGLFGIFTSGVLAIVLPKERPGPGAVRIARDWYAPAGGLLIFACGAFSLIAFPLDDVWHRLFGQDVTLWGPTHLMLIGGAGLSLVGQAVLLAEGLRARERTAHAERPAGRLQLRPEHVTAARRIGLMGGLLVGLSTFQAEFDFGVPQYRLVFQPLLIALAAGGALVAARIWVGRGGALGTALFFLGLRGLVSLLVGPVFGQTMPSLPLYLGEALCVELLALVLVRRPLLFGALSGVAIGTAGFASEWGWSQFAMRLPWSADLLPEAVVFAVAAGVAGGVAGALLALGLRGELPRPAVARPAMVLATAAVAALVATRTAHERSGRRARRRGVAPRARGRRRDRRGHRAHLAAVACRRPRVGDRHRLAGRRPARRPAPARRAGSLPDELADPGARFVEVARAGALGQRRGGRAHLHARRPGDSGRRGPGGAALQPAAAARHRGPAARA